MNNDTILVVDDTLESLKLLTDILETENYNVRPANSGEIALVSIAVNLPQLILLDIMMPGMDGFEVLHRLKSNPITRDIPVLILSAFSETEQRVKGLEQGAIDFISKPFQRQELLAKVKNHLELHQLRLARDSQLSQAKQEAEQASQAKKEFLASMSHELYTPLNAVLGFAQLLTFEKLTTEQDFEVQAILTAGHHLLDLVNEVLLLSKIESDDLTSKIEEFELATLVQTCLSLAKPLTLKNKVRLIDNSQSCACRVKADSLQLKQIVLNLISNAIKYNKTGGSVTLYCEIMPSQKARLNVVDTGQGLSESQQMRLFQPFERLSAKNSSIEGAGLGLCISKRMIEAMNGGIGVESIVNEGSRFWIEVPLA